MKVDYPTEKNLYDYEYNMKHRPHVVLLGAGASCAAILNGDKSGRKLDIDFCDIDKLTCDLIIDEENKKGTKQLLSDPYA